MHGKRIWTRRFCRGPERFQVKRHYPLDALPLHGDYGIECFTWKNGEDAMTKYVRIKGGYLCMCFSAAGLVKGIGKTKYEAAYEVYRMFKRKK